MRNIPELAKDYLDSLSGTHSARTINAYAVDLNCFFRYMQSQKKNHDSSLTLEELAQLKEQDIEDYKSYLGDLGNGRAAIRRKLLVLSGYFQYYVKAGYFTRNPAAGVIIPPLAQKKMQQKLSHMEGNSYLSNVEFGTALTKKQKPYHKYEEDRDLAIIFLLMTTGIHISECARLDFDDFYFDDNSVFITQRNGQVARIIYTDEAKVYLMAYASIRPNTDDPAFFLNRFRTRLSERSIQILVKKYSSILPDQEITPKRLRETFSGWQYKKDAISRLPQN